MLSAEEALSVNKAYQPAFYYQNRSFFSGESPIWCSRLWKRNGQSKITHTFWRHNRNNHHYCTSYAPSILDNWPTVNTIGPFLFITLFMEILALLFGGGFPLLIIACVVLWPLAIRIVDQYEKGDFTLGKFSRVAGAGTSFHSTIYPDMYKSRYAWACCRCTFSRSDE